MHQAIFSGGHCKNQKYGLDEGQHRKGMVNAYEDCSMSPSGTGLSFLSFSVMAALLEPNFSISGKKKKRSLGFFENIYEILEKIKSVFENVLIGKKPLAVLPFAKKTAFFKIKISRCLEGSLLKNGKNI